MEGSTIAAILIGSVAGGVLADWHVAGALAMMSAFYDHCSLFWGAGVTLRFLLMLWVPVALGITDNTTPTTLNAMVAVGIVFGAAAARFIRLETVRRCMPAGIVLGGAVVIFSVQHHLLPAYGLLAVIGMLGGFFIVPLNALLQHRGQQSVGAGNAIVVQNFAENIAMLLMLGLYTLVVSLQVAAAAIGVGFGLLFVLAIAVLWWFSQGGARAGQR